MNVHEIDQMNQHSLIDFLFGKTDIKREHKVDRERTAKRDSFELSMEGAEMLAENNRRAATSRNRKVDQSIDLLAYIEEARCANKEAVDHAGNEIKSNNMDVYQETYHVFKKALIDKYTKLADEARSHADPEEYLLKKYRNKSCAWYVADLTDREREIAYHYERQMLETGTIKGVKFQDSLFRGILVKGETDIARVAFNRQMVNAQIGNIFQENGIELREGEQCVFSVDPYSYRISVSGVEEEMRLRMENALNVGENGKNLFFHINHCAVQDGANSRQVTEDGSLKHQVYQDVLQYTGLELNALEERDGSYYTKEGKDICGIVCAAIDASPEIPVSFKPQMQEAVCGRIHELAGKGRDTVRDMILRIGYSEGELVEKDQGISFSMKAESLRRALEGKDYITI